MIRGTCECEGVEIAVERIGPVGYLCYCTICRKVAGAPFAAAVVAEREGFRVVRGWDLLAKHNATPNYDRWHCSRCHAAVYGDITDQPQSPLYVSAAILDPEAVRDVRFEHIFVRSVVPWHQIQDDRPQHPTYPA